MSKPFAKLQQSAPKYILALTLILMAALIMSLVWPELRPELINIEGGTVVSSAELDATVSGDTSVNESSGIEADEKSTTREKHQSFPIYLTGAVIRPGIYYLEEGDIMADAVSLAGGLAEDAASDHVNLAMALSPNDMLRIPFLDEIAAGSIPTLPDERNKDDSEEVSPGPVNINQADVQMLCTLPGIGEATAKAIVAWREEHGLFNTIEDIMQVSGIKEARFNQIKALIST